MLSHLRRERHAEDGAPLFVPLLEKSRSFDCVPSGYFAQNDNFGGNWALCRDDDFNEIDDPED